MDFLVLILFLLIIFIFYFIYSFLQKNINKLNEENKSLKIKELDYIKEISTIKATLNAKEESLSSKHAEISEIKEQMTKDFRLLANEILEEKSYKFTNLNKINLESILMPLREKINEFKHKIEETYDKESKERFSLEGKIKELIQLNNKISDEANNLAQALKGESKMQGDWGEMILDSILEKSGLRKDKEYFTQAFIRDEKNKKIIGEHNKAMQPDVIVRYPGGREIIIDSKTSLTAYIDYTNSEGNDDKNDALKRHIQSLKNHIDELALKSYHKYLDTVDFVMMFVPNESAYILAMKTDNKLWDYAYSKKVLLINPTNLIASLKVVEGLWKREYQAQNVLEISERGAILYDKFVGFEKTLRDIGIHLEKAHEKYEISISQLSLGKGNLIGQAEKLKKLGIKNNKNLPKYSEETYDSFE